MRSFYSVFSIGRRTRIITLMRLLMAPICIFLPFAFAFFSILGWSSECRERWQTYPGLQRTHHKANKKRTWLDDCCSRGLEKKEMLLQVYSGYTQGPSLYRHVPDIKTSPVFLIMALTRIDVLYTHTHTHMLCKLTAAVTAALGFDENRITTSLRSCMLYRWWPNRPFLFIKSSL